ncbi:MAG: HNH endonuclease signature motif containing protein [Candidatus Gracilibacteria bacterium]
MTNPMTDQQLYEKAKFYGKNALLWRRKFMGLLPEIYKRRLFERKGFSSIFEFSFKLAGLSAEQVRRVLSLEKRFEKTPLLKNLLVNGEVSMNKLARVASVATPENEQELVTAVKILPKSAVETLVRDEKMALENQNGLFEPKIEDKSVPGHNSRSPALKGGVSLNSPHSELQLTPELTARLLAMQNKGIDINKILTEFLDKRDDEIAQEKAEIAENLPETHSRYIPVHTRQVLIKEHGTKCSIPNCNKPAEHIHHTQIFSLSQRHDPHYLAPLCRNHHILAHAINMKVQEKIGEYFGQSHDYIVQLSEARINFKL